MGASFIHHVFDDCHRQELRSLVNHEREHAIIESGTSYSGDLGSAPSGVRILETTYDTEDQAYDWLCENHPKWSEPWAVRFHVPKEGDKKIAKLTQELKDAMSEKSKVCKWRTPTAHHNREVVQPRIQSQKAEFKSCNGCGSRVATKHIKFGQCPVCDSATSFHTGGDTKAIESIGKKLDKLNEKIENIQTKIDEATKKSSEVKWMVGCWCSS